MSRPSRSASAPAAKGCTRHPRHLPPVMSPSSLLARLGLDRPELRAWAMYDWAASAMQTTIMVAVFPIYFVKVAGAGLAESGATQRLATVNTIALVIIALLSPMLGAIVRLRRRPRSGSWPASCWSGVAGGGAGCSSSTRGDLDARVARSSCSRCIGATGSFVFYEALLPHIARPDEIDRVSTAGYALGYVGGGLLLALNLAWIQKPELVRPAVGPGLADAQATLPVAARLPVGRGLVAACSRSRCSAGCPSRRRGSSRTSAGARARSAMAFVAPGRDLPRAARLPAGVPDAAGVPDLQRRHPHHHQDGHGLRHRARHRPERADRRHPAGAVRRHPVLVPVRHAGRPDRRQAGAVPRAAGLHGDQRRSATS